MQKLPKNALTVHVLGEGIGESIILELPNGKWGVVDCYAHSIQDETKNQTLNFLKQRNVQALEFLCLSHPHEDHFRGITHLLKAYDGKLKEFWLFPARTWKNVKKVLAHLRIIAEAKEPVDLDNVIQREGIDELDGMFQTIGRLQKYGKLTIRLTEDFKLLYSDVVEFGEENAQLKIFSLAPAGNLIYAYQQAIEESLIDEQKFAQTYYQRHNLISSVLLLKYGETKVVLGGDAEKQSWNYILNDELRIKEGESLRAHLVKVSHHGSRNGLTENLWATLAEDGECYAVITPFQSRHLPEKQALSSIAKHTKKMFVTSLKALKFLQLEEIREYLFSSSSGKLCRCSFSFDGFGTCLYSECEGAAGEVCIDEYDASNGISKRKQNDRKNVSTSNKL